MFARRNPHTPQNVVDANVLSSFAIDVGIPALVGAIPHLGKYCELLARAITLVFEFFRVVTR